MNNQQEPEPPASFGLLTVHVAPGHDWKGKQRDLSPPHHSPEQPFDPSKLKGRNIGAVLAPRQGKHTKRILRHDESAEIAGATYDQPLYLRFAELEIGDLEGIAQFANQFGLLGWPVSYEMHDAVGHKRHTHGEPWTYWAIEINRMKAAVKLRNRAGADPQFDHSSRIDVQKEPHLLYFREILMRQEEADHLMAQTGIHRPSRLERIMNGQLRSLRAIIVTEPTGRMRLELRPETLLAFLWLQCALSADRGHEIRKCSSCPRYFQVGTGDARTLRRKHCTPRCKMRQSRRSNRKTHKQHRSVE